MRGASSFSSEGIGAFQKGKMSPVACSMPFETFDIFPTGMVCTLKSTKNVRMYYDLRIQRHLRDQAGEPPLS